MRITRDKIEAARRAEYDHAQRNRLLGPGPFRPTSDAVIKAMLEAALRWGEADRGSPYEPRCKAQHRGGDRQDQEREAGVRGGEAPEAMMVERSGSILLVDVAEHLTTLEIACNRCERKGRAAMDRLMAEHGPAMSMPKLLALLSADCPKRQSEKMHDVCGAHFPQLPSIFLREKAP